MADHIDDRQAQLDGIAAALAQNVRDLAAQPLPPGLHLVATPIGNLGDISPRTLTTLARADRVYCEDTRVSGPMLGRFAVNRRLASYHEHNADAVRREVLAALDAGERIALISDAGTPAISDPGFKLAREAIAAGHDVYTVPGPSALIAAVTVSGLPTDSFYFAGFLPQKATARRARIEALAQVPSTLVLFESPHRITAALQDLSDVLGSRDAAVTRELTKRYEEVRRGTLAQLVAWSVNEPPRGEIAIVVDAAAPPASSDVGDEAILAAARSALAELKPAAAAKAIAKRLGVPRSRVYDLILFLKKEQTGK